MEGSIAIVNREGDSKLIWSTEQPDEVANARRMFDDLKAKGYSAFYVLPDGRGEKGNRLDRFDPAAGKIIMVPPMRGG